MPTCLASSTGLLRSSIQHHSSYASTVAQCARRIAPNSSVGVRRVSNTAARPGLPAKLEEQRAHVLTVLHKTTSLLPRILPSSKPGPNGVSLRESLAFWEDVLGKVYEDLTLTSEKREKDLVRIVGAWLAIIDVVCV